jgi:hypothetical protein
MQSLLRRDDKETSFIISNENAPEPKKPRHRHHTHDHHHRHHRHHHHEHRKTGDQIVAFRYFLKLLGLGANPGSFDFAYFLVSSLYR